MRRRICSSSKSYKWTRNFKSFMNTDEIIPFFSAVLSDVILFQISHLEKTKRGTREQSDAFLWNVSTNTPQCVCLSIFSPTRRIFCSTCDITITQSAHQRTRPSCHQNINKGCLLIVSRRTHHVISPMILILHFYVPKQTKKGRKPRTKNKYKKENAGDAPRTPEHSDE